MMELTPRQLMQEKAYMRAVEFALIDEAAKRGEHFCAGNAMAVQSEIKALVDKLLDTPVHGGTLRVQE